MGSSKVRDFKNPKNRCSDSKQFLPPQHIQNLISAIQAPQGLKPPILKRLYNLLVHLSLNGQICCPVAGADSTFWDINIDRNGIRVSSKHICLISDVLFKELSRIFNQFLSALHDFSANRTLRRASLHSAIWAIAELLNLLLRCCLVMLNLLVPDRLLKNGQVLLDILGELCSLDLAQENEENTIGFEKVSVEFTYKDTHCTASSNEDIVASLHFMEPVNPCLPFLCTSLEVFADELLVHGQLRECFKLIGSLTSTRRKLCHSSHGDIGCVIDIISTHFCLSFSDEQAFENFLNRLFWPNGKDNRAPELSLTAALVLLLNPFMLSAPKFLHANLISLVSEAITFGLSLGSMRADVRLIDCYLSAFERSVILYVKHMSTLQMNDKSNEDSVLKINNYQGNSQPTFESCIQPVTRQKIRNLISKLDNSWQLQLRDMFLRTKSDLATSSIAYLKESKHILDTSFREEIVSILSCIIWKAFSIEADDATLYASGEKNPQDICFLASILKLMSCSLLQAIWCLRHNGNLGCLRTLKDFSSCKEYDSMVGIISRFQQLKICLPVQKSLCGLMGIHPKAHKESRVMLLQFAGLLSISFSTGLEFLVNGCISAMMSLMNFIVFEEGNLDALRSDYRSESFSLYPDNVSEAKVEKKSSLVVASKFLKIQTLYFSVPSLSSESIGRENDREETLTRLSSQKNMQSVVGIEEETEETCNGEIFLNCRMGNRGQPPDFDDLADFIECKRGKDYTGWLKDRQKYRKWKCEKVAVLRWKKRKTWKFMKGKKT